MSGFFIFPSKTKPFHRIELLLKILFFIFIVLLFSEILLPVLWMTGRDVGPNLQMRNTETEAEAETEAETDTDERNGNTDTEDRVLVQGETLKDRERGRKKKKERQRESEYSKIRER